MTDTEREIVCLCGSTRFKKEYRKANKRLSLEGKIVLSVGFFGHADGVELTERQKREQDRIHKRKIDMADRILVINPGGYIGDSTKDEITYARGQGTEITALEPPVAESPDCEMDDCEGFAWTDVHTVEDEADRQFKMCDRCFYGKWDSHVAIVGQ